jgi:hypothetical protein
LLEWLCVSSFFNALHHSNVNDPFTEFLLLLYLGHSFQPHTWKLCTVHIKCSLPSVLQSMISTFIGYLFTEAVSVARVRASIPFYCHRASTQLQLNTHTHTYIYIMNGEIIWICMKVHSWHFLTDWQNHSVLLWSFVLYNDTKI